MDYVVKYMNWNGYIRLADGTVLGMFLYFEDLTADVETEKSFNVRIQIRSNDNKMDVLCETMGKAIARKVDETTAEINFCDEDTDFIGKITNTDYMLNAKSIQKDGSSGPGTIILMSSAIGTCANYF